VESRDVPAERTTQDTIDALRQFLDSHPNELQARHE
jgi:hypothetical protein